MRTEQHRASCSSTNAANLEWLRAQIESLNGLEGTRTFTPPAMSPQQAVDALRHSAGNIPLPAEDQLLAMATDFSRSSDVGQSTTLCEQAYGDFLSCTYKLALAELAEQLARDWIERLNAEEPNVATLDELCTLLHGGSCTRAVRRTRLAWVPHFIGYHGVDTLCV